MATKESKARPKSSRAIARKSNAKGVRPTHLVQAVRFKSPEELAMLWRLMQRLSEQSNAVAVVGVSDAIRYAVRFASQAIADSENSR